MLVFYIMGFTFVNIYTILIVIVYIFYFGKYSKAHVFRVLKEGVGH